MFRVFARSCYVVFPCQQIVLSLGCLMGLVMFARYGEDSPLDKGYVKTKDQVSVPARSYCEDRAVSQPRSYCEAKDQDSVSARSYCEARSVSQHALTLKSGQFLSTLLL